MQRGSRRQTAAKQRSAAGRAARMAPTATFWGSGVLAGMLLLMHCVLLVDGLSSFYGPAAGSACGRAGALVTSVLSSVSVVGLLDMVTLVYAPSTRGMSAAAQAIASTSPAAAAVVQLAAQTVVDTAAGAAESVAGVAAAAADQPAVMQGILVGMAAHQVHKHARSNSACIGNTDELDPPEPLSKRRAKHQRPREPIARGHDWQDGYVGAPVSSPRKTPSLNSAGYGRSAGQIEPRLRD
jgi:hypothetical protein